MRRRKVVTIGGGGGMPMVDEALLRSGEVDYIHSIVTVMDSGGATGRMRTDARGQIVAYSDAMRVMLSLVDPGVAGGERVRALKELMNSRGVDGVIGHRVFDHLFDGEGNFSAVQGLLERLTGLNFRGEVIPVTLGSADIVFKTEGGGVYKGEHELDGRRMSAALVAEMWLEPQVGINPRAAGVIEEAGLIVYSCGSLYGSILANFLPEGMREAISSAKAVKILVTNLMSTRSETHDFSPGDYISKLKKYTGLKKPVDWLVVPEMTRRKFEADYPAVAEVYGDEYSHFLGWGDKELGDLGQEGVKVVRHRATVVDPNFSRVRHDPMKLAETFRELIRSLRTEGL